MTKKTDPKWMQHAGESMREHGTKGELHRKLHVPKDETIPMSDINAALKKRGLDVKTRKQLQFAKTAKEIQARRKHTAEAGHEPQLRSLVDWASEHGIAVATPLPWRSKVKPGALSHKDILKTIAAVLTKDNAQAHAAQYAILANIDVRNAIVKASEHDSRLSKALINLAATIGIDVAAAPEHGSNHDPVSRAFPPTLELAKREAEREFEEG